MSGEGRGVLDDVTAKIVTVLIENPKLAYNKTELINAAGVGRNGFYERFDTLLELDIIQEADDINSSNPHYRLNTDSEIVNTFAKVLYLDSGGGV